MAVFGSILVNRQIKQLLSYDDMQSDSANAIKDKLIAGGKDTVEKLLEAIPNADQSHQSALRDICNEILKNTSVDVFIEEMDNDDTVIRDAAKDVLSQSQAINPSTLLNKLTDPNSSISQILDVVEFQKEHLKPEQVITQALKLNGKESKRLFDLAGSLVQKFNINEFDIQPNKVDSPDKKLHLLKFLGKIHSPKAAELSAQFLDDKNHMVTIAALNSLKTINQKFDVLPVLNAIPSMKDAEKKLALPLAILLADESLVGKLAPLLTNKDEELRSMIARLIVEKATTECFRQLLIGIEKRDQWGQDEAINVLIEEANGQLSSVARPLLNDSHDFIKNTALKFIDANDESGSFQDLSHAAFNDDWQIRQKAIDVLANSGQKDSLKILAKVFKEKPDAAIPVLKAIQTLNMTKGLELAVRGLGFKEAAVQRESLKAIKHLINDKHAQTIQDILIKKYPTFEKVVLDSVEEVLSYIHKTYQTPPLPNLNEQASEKPGNQATQVIENAEIVTQHIDMRDELQKQQDIFDLNELVPGVMWADRYEIEKEIGRGAMGRVLLAKDTMVDEIIIVKFMHPELTADEAARERFIRELKYARKISHPNVIRIHDFLYQKNVAAISMEFFESQGLDDIVKKGKVYEEQEGLDVLSQIAAGMQAAHDEQVIHRDLKPSNVLVNDLGKVKVVDFGIASATAELDANLTKTGTIIGTPAYLSPERAKGLEADHRADIYALGVIAYFMFTGDLPYKGEPMSLLFQHIEGKAEMVHVINPKLNAKLSFLVKKMMAVNVDDRYQSMADVKLAIEKLQN